jgi:hypothetical protein
VSDGTAAADGTASDRWRAAPEVATAEGNFEWFKGALGK